MKNSSQNYRASILNQWMTEAGISDYRELSRLSRISELQFYRLENGLLDSIPLGILKKIACSLNLSLSTFIDGLNEVTSSSTKVDQIEQKKLVNYQWEYQQEAISILESLIIQLPTLIYVVEKNPNLPANKLIPLLHPLDELLSAWEMTKIGNVGEIVPYNPQEHQLIDQTDLEISEGQLVKIRYVGYKSQNKLLYRAKVSSMLEQ